MGRLDVTGVFQHSQDSVYFGSGAASPVAEGFTGAVVLPPGARSAIWNGGTVEAHYTYSPQLFFIGRYETERMQQQSLPGTLSNVGNADVWTAGYRFYPFMSSRAGFALHNEASTLRLRRVAPDTGADVRNTSVLVGFDFAW